MTSDPSRSINPVLLAKTKERIEGEVKLASLARLKGILLENEGELKYSFAFEIDESGICVVNSDIQTRLILECQRCFKPIEIELQKSSILGVVNEKDEFDTLAKEYEPLQLEGGVTTLQELIEDELLLSVPLSILHPVNECSGVEDLNRINAEAKLQPFAGLASLLKNKD
jgi:uncharacterized protein